MLKQGKVGILNIDLRNVKIFWDAPKLKGETVMDFISKNWSRLSLAFLYFIGGVIAVIAWVNIPSDYAFTAIGWLNNFYKVALIVSTIVYFFGMVGVTIMKTMQNSKKIVNILYMSVGGLITVLLMVLMIVASCNDSNLILIFGNRAIASLYQLWVPIFVFGLHPLIKGVTRFIEAEMVPAQAKVQPAAAPVAKTAPAKAEAPKAKAAAPKAPVKKAAPKAPAAK